MALVKCSECGQEVSDKAVSCPHCGNPLWTGSSSTDAVPRSSLQNKSLEKRKRFFTLNKFLWTIFLVTVALIPICFKISQTFINPEKYASQHQKSFEEYLNRNKSADPNEKNLKKHEVQETNLWGYKFYTSKVDQTGSIDIGSEAKQKIANLFKALGYPPRLTQSLAVVYVDPTLIGKNDRLKVPWAGESAVTIALQPEGGIYVSVSNGAVIYINNLKSSNKSILTHELGHQIGHHLTDDEWTQFYKLRGIPEKTLRRADNWNLSPEEDFAEVYKGVYESSVTSGFDLENWTVTTQYGLLVPSFGSDEVSSCSKLVAKIEQDYIHSHSNEKGLLNLDKAETLANQNSKVQECRRKNNGKSQLGGMMYVSEVDKPTEQFIKDVVARLNRS